MNKVNLRVDDGQMHVQEVNSTGQSANLVRIFYIFKNGTVLNGSQAIPADLRNTQSIATAELGHDARYNAETFISGTFLAVAYR